MNLPVSRHLRIPACLLGIAVATAAPAGEAGCPAGDAVAGEIPVEELIVQAECLRRGAAAAGYEWLQTREILEEAQQKAEQGEAAEARLLAQQALFQAMAALLQAEHEEQAWKRRAVR